MHRGNKGRDGGTSSDGESDNVKPPRPLVRRARCCDWNSAIKIDVEIDAENEIENEAEIELELEVGN